MSIPQIEFMKMRWGCSQFFQGVHLKQRLMIFLQAAVFSTSMQAVSFWLLTQIFSEDFFSGMLGYLFWEDEIGENSGQG